MQVSDGHRLPLQALEYVEVQRRKKNLGWLGVLKLRIQLAAVVGALLFGVAAVLYPTGYFGPISSRIRSLFVKHTRTGNPLVDSVAEHQPASAQAYKQYLSKVYDIAPWGFVFSFLNLSDANTFVILYAIVAYYFSSKMARLVILLGPVSSALGGVFIGFLTDELLFNAVGKLILSVAPPGIAAPKPAAAADGTLPRSRRAEALDLGILDPGPQQLGREDDRCRICSCLAAHPLTLGDVFLRCHGISEERYAAHRCAGAAMRWKRGCAAAAGAGGQRFGRPSSAC